MMHRVVRPFSLSLNGLTLIDLNVGDERSDWGGMEDGLVAEGYIEPVLENPAREPATDKPAPVAVPLAPPSGRRRGR
jgi:hypothetical protein